MSSERSFSLLRAFDPRQLWPQRRQVSPIAVPSNSGITSSEASGIPQQEQEPVVIPEDLSMLSERLTVTFRELFVLEGPKRKDTIDFDLAPAPEDQEPSLYQRTLISAPTRAEWKAVVSILTSEIAEVEVTQVPDDGRLAMQREVMVRKLEAHSAFYTGKAGTRIPWRERVEITQGVEPVPIDEESIMAQREKALAIFRELGYKDLTKEELARYRENTRLTNEEFMSAIEQNSKVILDEISTALKRDLRPNFTVEADSKNAYWLNWSNGTRDNFKLRVNLHPRHSDKKTIGKAWAMAVHEAGGHFGQMAGWQEKIDSGQTLPVLGITSTHDPEQIASEGVAMTLHYYVPGLLKHLPQEALFELELEGFRQMMYHNVQIEANLLKDKLEGSEMSPEEETAKMASFVQAKITDIQNIYEAEPESEIRNQIVERTEDPEKSVYLFAYGYGFLFHQWIARTLNTQDRLRFLDVVYSQPTTPEQELHMVGALLQQNPVRYPGPYSPPFQPHYRN